MKRLTIVDMKRILGGNHPGNGGSGCSAKADCTGCKQVKCSGTNSCSGTDDSGVTCDSIETKCPKFGEPGCV